METLGKQVEVLSMPSGEEALLEVSRSPVQLMIADMRLPGMTGIELMHKMLKRSPEMRVILITGMTDPRIRKLVAEAGAYAFFLKPIEMPDFLDAAERALGLVESILPAPPISEPEKPIPTVGERLRELRAQTEAEAAAVMDGQGKVLEEAGHLPWENRDSNLFLALLSTVHASERVNNWLGQKVSHNVLSFQGPGYWLTMVPAGSDYYILTVIKIKENSPFPEGSTTAILNAIPGIQESLARLGAIELADLASSAPAPQEGTHPSEGAVEVETAPPPPAPVEEPENLELSEEEIESIESLFSPKSAPAIASEDLENFWDVAVDQADEKAGGNASALSFEEAQRLGLAPGETPEAETKS